MLHWIVRVYFYDPDMLWSSCGRLGAAASLGEESCFGLSSLAILDTWVTLIALLVCLIFTAVMRARAPGEAIHWARGGIGEAAAAESVPQVDVAIKT